MDIDEALEVLFQGGREQRKAAIQKVNEIAMPLFANQLAQEGETDQNVLEAMFRKGLAQCLLLMEEGEKAVCNTKSLLNLCLAQWMMLADTPASKKYLAKVTDQCRGFLFDKFEEKNGIDDWVQEAWLAFMGNLQRGTYKGGATPGVYFNSIGRNIGLKSISKETKVSLEGDVKDENPQIAEAHLRDDDVEQWLMTQVGKLKTNCSDILIDWANKSSAKEMMKKYDFASESVVYVRINACKQNLRKTLFAALGIKCKNLLLAFFAEKKKKQFYPEFYIDLATFHGYDSEGEYIKQIDHCLRGLSDSLIQ